MPSGKNTPASLPSIAKQVDKRFIANKFSLPEFSASPNQPEEKTLPIHRKGFYCIKKGVLQPVQHPTLNQSRDFCYQMTTRLEGARYMPSVFFTRKAAYHSGKFLGGILARR